MEEGGVEATLDDLEEREDASSRLLTACICGHLDVARAAVAAGASAAWANEAGWTPFYAACNAGFLEVAQWLYESVEGVPETVGWATSAGAMPLHAACAHGRLHVVQWLYECVPEAVSSVVGSAPGTTPLALAVRWNRAPVVQYLAQWRDVRKELRGLDRKTWAHNWAMVGPFVEYAHNCRAVDVACIVRRGCAPVATGAATSAAMPPGVRRVLVIRRIPLPAFVVALDLLIGTHVSS